MSVAWPTPPVIMYKQQQRENRFTCELRGRCIDAGDVVDARPPFVLLVHGIQSDEVLLCMTGNLHGKLRPLLKLE